MPHYHWAGRRQGPCGVFWASATLSAHSMSVYSSNKGHSIQSLIKTSLYIICGGGGGGVTELKQ